jgi:hypothetical protein
VPCTFFHIDLGATSIQEVYYLRQPGADQDKHIRYVKSWKRTKQRHISREREKGSVIQSVNPIGLVNIVRWHNLPHTLLLFFFSRRADIGPADELTLPFGFPVVAVAISALRFALLFEGGGGARSSSSFSSSSSSPESPPVPSSSSSDLSDEFVSMDESFDSGVFCANFVP